MGYDFHISYHCIAVVSSGLSSSVDTCMRLTYFRHRHGFELVELDKGRLCFAGKGGVNVILFKLLVPEKKEACSHRG